MQQQKEFHKIINLLNNTNNLPSRLKTEIQVEVNDDPHGAYNSNIQIKFKTTMLKPNPCDYSDPDIFLKGIITITDTDGGNKTVTMPFC